VGRIATLLSFVRTLRHGANVSDVKINPGGGPNITAEHFAPAGDDAHPLTTDYVITNEIPRQGGEVVVGYIDPKNTPKAQPGDKRIYARDSSGAVIVEVWLKNDGTALITNANGSVTLRPDGGTITETPAATFDVSAGGDITGSNSAATFNISAEGAIRGSNSPGFFELQSNGNFNINGAIIDIDGRFVDGDGLAFRTHVHAQDPDSDGSIEEDTNGPKNP
jgi:hypothetical protein